MWYDFTVANDLLFDERTSNEDYAHLGQDDGHEEASGEREDTEYEDTVVFDEVDLPLVKETQIETTTKPPHKHDAPHRQKMNKTNRVSEQEQLHFQITRELRAIKAAVGRINEGVDCENLPPTLRGGIEFDDATRPLLSKVVREEPTPIDPTPIYARTWFVTLVAFLCSCFFTTVSSLVLMLYLQKEVAREIRQGLARVFNDETETAQEMRILQPQDKDVQMAENAEQAL